MGCLRMLAALPIGLMAMGVTVWLLELASHALFPPSAEMQAAIEMYMREPGSAAAVAAIKAAIPTMPPGAYLMLAAAWTIGTLLGSYTAARIGGRGHSVLAGLVGLFSIVAIASNLGRIPHPEWMYSAALYLLPIGACACSALLAKSHARRQSGKRSPSAPGTAAN